MAGEFLNVWEDRNASEFAINADNLSAISPSILHVQKRILFPVNGQRDKLRIAGNTAIKIVNGNKHRLLKINNDIEFQPAGLLDTGSSLDPGTDYHVYMVVDSSGGNLVVSKNITFPDGATAENSRRIGGFHTLCADVGNLQTANHPLLGFMARDILTQSVSDLLHKPINRNALGMVYDPNTHIWTYIYMQSGTGVNTKSVYQGTVTKSRSWDGHSEDLTAVGMRMLTDAEFTSAAMGTVPYRAVQGAVDPITTGGKVDTAGQRIISNIGCEDMAGCYWVWIDESGGWDGGTTYVDTPPGGQGQIYGASPRKLVAGGTWSNAANAGARCRYASASRGSVSAHYGSRGAVAGQVVI